MDAFEHGPMASGAAHCHFTVQIDKAHIPISARSILDGKGPSMDELEVRHGHMRRVQKCWKAHFWSRTSGAQLPNCRTGSARISVPEGSWAAAAVGTQHSPREQGAGLHFARCVCATSVMSPVSAVRKRRRAVSTHAALEARTCKGRLRRQATRSSVLHGP